MNNIQTYTESEYLKILREKITSGRWVNELDSNDWFDYMPASNEYKNYYFTTAGDNGDFRRELSTLSIGQDNICQILLIDRSIFLYILPEDNRTKLTIRFPDDSICKYNRMARVYVDRNHQF